MYVCEREGKTIILTICIYQSFSSRLITVQTSLLQTIVILISPCARYNVFSRPFYITFTLWRHIFFRNYVNILHEMPITSYGIHKYNFSRQCGLINFKMIPLMYSQRDKPSSRNTITQNYVNSLCEIQITDITSPSPSPRYCYKIFIRP